MSMLGGGSTTKPKPPSVALRVQTAVAGKPIPIVWGQIRTTGNLIWYSNFSSSPAGGKSGGKGGGGGKGGKGASGQYNYTVFLMIGICEGPVAGVLQAWNGSTAETLAGLNMAAPNGSYTQNAWAWLESTYPSQALAYRGLCYVYAGPFALGASPALPNLNYEVLAAINGAIPGLPDADPSLVIVDALTNPNYGLSFPAAMIGDLSLYRAMCLASGLVVSDALVSATAANTYFGDLLDATNSEFVWSSGLLTVVPYGDVGAISGNGYIYNPPTTPLFSLGDDDFMKNAGGTTIGVSAYTSDDPVITVRKRRSNAMNDIKVEYLDRYSTYIDPDTGVLTSNAYNPTIVEVMDDASIATWGLRSAATKTMHFFCGAAAATTAANMQLRRQQVLNQFTFTLDQRYIVLDPMDLVEITDTSCGLVNQPVLITEITENSDSSLTFVAEEYLGATTAMPAYGLQASAGYVANYNIAPPTTNAPIVFAAPPEVASNGGLEIWLVASGPTGWGGCDVWVSGDGSTYLNVGRMIGPCRQGVLTTPFPAGSDPDTVDVCAVDLAESCAELLSGTAADADNANTLCYVDGELISYSTAELTSQYRYSLQGYMRRGVYGTPIGAHEAGAPFARLDSQVFKYAYAVSQIGNPLYIKLTAFNIYGGAEEELSGVPATEIVIPAPPAPSDVTGFGVSETNNIVSFSWNPVLDFALLGYDIGYAPKGTTNWSAYEMLTVSGAGTEMTNAEVPAGTWTFGIRAKDIAGQLSPHIATVDLVVTSQTETVARVEQSPGWPGTVSGFVRHYTGVLVPDDQNPISAYMSSWSVWTTQGGGTNILTVADYLNDANILAGAGTGSGFIPTPVATASYTAPVIDQGYDYNNRVYATVGTGLMPGQTGAPTIALSIDTWLTGATDPGTFTPWTIGYTGLRYLRMQITYSGIAIGSISYIDEFAPIIDSGTPPITYSQTATIAANGTIVTFVKPFHLPPSITPSVIGASPLYATVSAITATQCLVNVWDYTGASVGGSVNLSLSGE